MKKRYDLISIGLLALISPLFVFPRKNWNWILLAGVTAILFGRWFLERKLLRSTPIDISIAVLIILLLLGLLDANDLAAEAPKIAGLTFGILIFYLLTGILNSIFRIKIAITTFILMGLAVSLVGTLSRYEGSSIPQIDDNKIVRSIPKIILKFERAETGVNPNPLGGTLLLFIPLGIMAFANMKKKKGDAVKPFTRQLIIAGMAIILGLEIFAIMFSRSYGALMAFGFILLLIEKKRRRLKACFGFAIIIAIFFNMKSPNLIENSIVKGAQKTISQSIMARLPYWKGGLEIARGYPILGIGLDRLRVTPPFKYGVAHAHNQFIHLAAEMGIPALIAYVAILIGVGWMNIEVIRSKMPEWMILSMISLVWGQIGLVIFGIADAIPLGSKPGFFFWFSLALMTSIYLFGRDNQMLRNNTKTIEASG